jgi:hypothetical protein
MKPLSADTSPAAQEMHFALMRKLPDWKRLQLALELTQATRELVWSDINSRFGDCTAVEIRRRFIARMLSREDVIRAYGFDPKQEGY